MADPVPILLASQSPRRAALLAAAGIAYEVLDVGPVDERPPTGPAGAPLRPGDVVEELARRKAEAAADRARTRLVLAADTLVFCDRAILGKPRDAVDARRTLASLSGRAHEVATGVALHGPDGAGGIRRCRGHRITRVHFRALSEQDVDAYVATGEPLDKAGSYALQGGAARFVTRIEGEADTVIGLPLALVRELMDAWEN